MWGTDPKTGFQVSPYLKTLQVSSCSFLRSGAACPRSWYFQDIDYVGSEVQGHSSGPPARWCSQEARQSPTVSCPMSWRSSDGTKDPMGALFADGRSFQTVDSTLRQQGRLSSSMWHVVGVMLRHVFAVLLLESGRNDPQVGVLR